MNCPKCKEKMRVSRDRHHYVECGLDNVWIRDCRYFECNNKHGRAVVLPDASQMNRLIAEALIVQEDRLGTDEIYFLRKAMCLTAQLLADQIGVNRIEVSRWENSRADMDPYHEFRFRMLVINRLLPEQRQSVAREAVSAVFSYQDMEKVKPSVDPINVSEDQLIAA